MSPRWRSKQAMSTASSRMGQWVERSDLDQVDCSRNSCMAISSRIHCIRSCILGRGTCRRSSIWSFWSLCSWVSNIEIEWILERSFAALFILAGAVVLISSATFPIKRFWRIPTTRRVDVILDPRSSRTFHTVSNETGEITQPLRFWVNFQFLFF